MEVGLEIGAVKVLQLLFTNAPPFQALFETQTAVGLGRMFLGGFIFFLDVELEKLIIRTVRHSRSAPLPAESAA